MTTSSTVQTPDFDYNVVSASTFEDLVAHRGNVISDQDLIAEALRRGRVLLQAPGGAGKTTTLKRLKRLAEDSGLRVGFVPVHRISIDRIEQSSIDGLLEASIPRLSREELAGGESLLLLVDGLSEVDRSTASIVLNAVDDWAALGPNSGTIVADRLVRRDIDTRRWALATLQSVQLEKVQELLGFNVSGAERELLTNPALLDRALALSRPFRSRSEAFAANLKFNTNFDEPTLSILANHALNHYRKSSSRIFLYDTIVDAVGSDATNQMFELKLLSPSLSDNRGQQFVWYRHHLIHDYLAARAASADPSEWTHELFDALSFRGSSYDSLAMLLELSPVESRDLLVRKVYDWNLYASAYLLAHDRHSDGTVTEATEHEVLALLGERRFDRFVASAQQVSDALTMHGSDLSARYLSASTPKETNQIASEQLPLDPMYQKWLTLFSNSTAQSQSQLVEYLTEADGVDGWTATNVVRRSEIDDRTLIKLINLTSDPTPVVRWRAVHALGMANKQATDRLFEVLTSDIDLSVRYGALRCIVEHALLSLDETRRDSIFLRLRKEVNILRQYPKLAREFARVLEVQAPPSHWAESASVVIEALLERAETTEQQDFWRNISSNLRLVWPKEQQNV
ncbi:hypothetical protein [Rhodococcus sp. IEGM 1318]|uniref:hypothetical protein n=1 Tax=Rhodococcus sp. IEGM 1318 TaxID=3082226 RepID=UPI0029530203|nr:hypothetical protein [Rhodococcus sp. IEGM 1318]MDV8004305.1 hypothetical protein [Rhodococcus sp. IEGM 1318]